MWYQLIQQNQHRPGMEPGRVNQHHTDPIHHNQRGFAQLSWALLASPPPPAWPGHRGSREPLAPSSHHETLKRTSRWQGEAEGEKPACLEPAALLGLQLKFLAQPGQDLHLQDFQ